MAEHEVIARARRLRKTPTVMERVLWSHLRDRRQAGMRFRRQMPIGPYVADFACLKARLIVEVDGGVHDLRTWDDARKDDWLRSRGFTVIRFTNGDVRNRLNDVLASIRSCAPSPSLGEGGSRSETDGGLAAP